MSHTDQQLDDHAVQLINRLLKVIDEQKKTISQYEGAIEGVKLFMAELRKKEAENGQDTDLKSAS